MRMMFRIWVPGLTVVLGLLAANTSPDPFDRVVTSLASGSAAERSGRNEIMLSSASTLVREGAVPAAGSEDVALRWFEKARSASHKNMPASAAYRDRALGAGYRMIAIVSGGAAQFEQTFLAGQRARIAVVALTKADYSLSVRDDEGQSVCVNTPQLGRCDWVPAWTTRYKIELSNRSKTKSDYYVVMQ